MIIDASRIEDQSHWPFTVMTLFFIGLIGCLFVHWIQATFRRSKCSSQPGVLIIHLPVSHQLFANYLPPSLKEKDVLSTKVIN